MCSELAHGSLLRWLLFDVPVCPCGDDAPEEHESQQPGFHAVLMRSAAIEQPLDLCDRLAWGRDQLMLHVYVPVESTEPVLEVR